MRKHTDEELIEELIRLRDQLGRNPLQTDFAIHSKYSVNSYKRAFGGLSKALIKIGEKPNIKLDSSNYNILEEIKRVYDILKHPPDIDEFNKYSDISYAAIRRELKNPSWHKLLIDAGIPIEEMAHHNKRNITNEELKNEVLRLKSVLGRYPSYNEMTTIGLYSYDTYEQRFGSYIKAMHALGFTDYENQNFLHNQTNTLGKDGVKYKSLFEAETANYLLKLVESNQIKTYQLPSV